jgi:hypothetical protein
MNNQFGQQQPNFGGIQQQFGGVQPQFGNVQQQSQFGGVQPQFGGIQQQQPQFGGIQQQFGGVQPQFGAQQQSQFGGVQPQFGGIPQQQQFGAQQQQFGGVPQQQQFGVQPNMQQYGGNTQQSQSFSNMLQSSSSGTDLSLIGGSMSQIALDKRPIRSKSITSKPIFQVPININNTQASNGADIEGQLKLQPQWVATIDSHFLQLCQAFGPPQITQPVGNLKKLSSFLASEQDLFMNNGCIILQQVTTVPENQIWLGQSQIMILIVKILHYFEAKPELVAHALFVLNNLIVQEINRGIARNIGVLPALIHLVGLNLQGSPVVERALMVLGILLSDMNTKIMFMQMNGLEKLTDVLDGDDSVPDNCKIFALRGLATFCRGGIPRY